MAIVILREVQRRLSEVDKTEIAKNSERCSVLSRRVAGEMDAARGRSRPAGFSLVRAPPSLFQATGRHGRSSMKKWLKRLQAWRVQRQQLSLTKWEGIRTKGKARFVVRTALIFWLTMIAVTCITDYLFDGRIKLSEVPFRVVFYLLTGFIVGFGGWSDREAKYKNARRLIE